MAINLLTNSILTSLRKYADVLEKYADIYKKLLDVSKILYKIICPLLTLFVNNKLSIPGKKQC